MRVFAKTFSREGYANAFHKPPTWLDEVSARYAIHWKGDEIAKPSFLSLATIRLGVPSIYYTRDIEHVLILARAQSLAEIPGKLEEERLLLKTGAVDFEKTIIQLAALGLECRWKKIINCESRDLVKPEVSWWKAGQTIYRERRLHFGEPRPEGALDMAYSADIGRYVTCWELEKLQRQGLDAAEIEERTGIARGQYAEFVKLFTTAKELELPKPKYKSDRPYLFSIQEENGASISVVEIDGHGQITGDELRQRLETSPQTLAAIAQSYGLSIGQFRPILEYFNIQRRGAPSSPPKRPKRIRAKTPSAGTTGSTLINE